MEIDLRLTLIAVGAVILLAVLWDYRRRRKPRPKPPRNPRMGPASGTNGVDDDVAALAGMVATDDEPVIDLERLEGLPWLDEESVEFRVADASAQPGQIPASGGAASGTASDGVATGEGLVTKAAPRRPSKPAPPPPASKPAPPPEEVVVLHVVAAVDRPFGGTEILEALEDEHLQFGDMGIYHYDERGARLFSVANMVKPGTFERASSPEFSSPGLALFLGLPGPANPTDAFDRMLQIAQGLAARLAGELRDETRSTVTAQTIQAYRDRIAEFERAHRRHLRG